MTFRVLLALFSGLTAFITFCLVPFCARGCDVLAVLLRTEQCAASLHATLYGAGPRDC